MIELILRPTSSSVSLTSSLGMTIHYCVELESDCKPFALQSGFALDEITFSLDIYTESITKPFFDFEDGNKCGELAPTFYMQTRAKTSASEKKSFGITLFVYDFIFNTLISSHQHGALPNKVILRIDDDETAADCFLDEIDATTRLSVMKDLIGNAPICGYNIYT